MRRYSSKIISDIMDSSVEKEGRDIPPGKFVGRSGKIYKVSLSIATLLGIIGGAILLSIPEINNFIGAILLVLGVGALLLLPTFFSYRCYIDNEILAEEYLIILYRRKKEVKWSDIKYKRIDEDEFGKITSVRFYGEDKRKLIDFDNSIVGFQRIVNLAKRSSIKTMRD